MTTAAESLRCAVEPYVKHLMRQRNMGAKTVQVNVVELESVLKSINYIVAENQELRREHARRIGF